MLRDTKHQVRLEAGSARVLTLARSGLRQRKCACGGSPGLDGECEGCHRKRLAVPPIIHEVLRSPGQPLDPVTAASGVRVRERMNVMVITTYRLLIE